MRAASPIREIQVESDTNKLVNFCRLNYKVEDEPIPVKPDSNLPTMRSPPPLSTLAQTLAAVDGWHRKEHPVSHSGLAYGDLALAFREWSATQSKDIQ